MHALFLLYLNTKQALPVVSLILLRYCASSFLEIMHCWKPYFWYWNLSSLCILTSLAAVAKTRGLAWINTLIHLLFLFSDGQIFYIEDLTVDLWRQFLRLKFYLGKGRTFGQLIEMVMRGHFNYFFPKLILDFAFDFILPLPQNIITNKLFFLNIMGMNINLRFRDLADNSVIKLWGSLTIPFILW